MEEATFNPKLQRGKAPTWNGQGFSFDGLHVNGYTSSDFVQHNFLSQLRSLLPTGRSLLWRPTNRTKIPILRDFHGVVQRGEMLLVLGKPGSGCSTFLRTVAGDIRGTTLQNESMINYQGTGFTEMHKLSRGDSIYVSELDLHLPELKVGETLSFAASMRPHHQHEFQGPSQPETQTEPLASGAVRSGVASIFGLSSAFDTFIGSDMLRGISGGEKKRVSIAEAFVSGANIQCWDNSTRGLDSLTALKFVQTLRKSADTVGTVTLMSIYQSLEAMYDCFDKVILLYEGREIYFGSTKNAAAYFEELGFVRPPRARTADFLTSLTSPAERIVREGYDDRVPRSPDQFAETWRNSKEYAKVIAEIGAFNQAYPLSITPGSPSQNSSTLAKRQHSTYSISSYRQVTANLHRALLRIINNPAPMASGIIGNAIIAVILGSAFYNLAPTAESLQARSIVIFYTIMINSCLPAFEVLTMWAQRPIVEKQSRYAFYAPPTEFLASMIIDLPNKILTSLLFNIPVYFLTNLQRTAPAFFTFYLISFTAMLTMSMAFRMVGSLSRTHQQAMTPVATMVMLFIIYAGFVVPERFMVVWLGWIRWINPIAYAYESLMINEFQDRTYRCSTLIPRGGNYGTSIDGKVCPTVGARPGESYVLGNEYLGVKYSYAISHLWRNFGILIAMMAIFCCIHLVAANYILAARSKGEVLLYRYGQMPKKSQKADEEYGMPGMDSVDSMEKRDRIYDSFGDSSELQKHRSVYHWSNLSYEIKTGKTKKTILNDMNGWMKPGTLTALMGATGAGKTSLLDTLRGCHSVGVVTGEIHVGSNPRSTKHQRHIAYVQQSDLHLSTTTVREALQFSALLRQPPHVPDTEKLRYVETVMSMLEMQDIADAVVGTPGEGLNVEQRKRLTIGVELAAKPELLLFLDEPTSGLDSQAAFAIVRLLRRLANAGQAIMCTIHQPSSQLFQLFDRLLLLQAGHTIYFGPIGAEFSDMIKYFENRGAQQCAEGENPAEWVMKVSGSRDTDQGSQHWIDMWASSDENKYVKRHLEELKFDSESKAGAEASDQRVYAAGVLKQLKVVVGRQLQEYWRDPTYLYAKLSLCAVAALLNGLSFYNISNSIQSLTSVLFSVFLLSILFSSLDQQIIPRFITARTLFNARERESMTYSWVTFLASNIIVETIWQTFTAVLVFVCWYFPIGLWRSDSPRFDNMNSLGEQWASGERMGMIWCLIWLFMVFISGLSQAIAAGIDQAETAVNIAQLLFGLSTIFCGVLIVPSALPGFWMFMYRVSPFTYLISGLSIACLADTTISCDRTELLQFNVPAATNLTCAEYLKDFIDLAGGYIDNNQANLPGCWYCPASDANTVLRSLGLGDKQEGWRNVGIFAVYVVANFAGVFALYWVVFQRYRRSS